MSNKLKKFNDEGDYTFKQVILIGDKGDLVFGFINAQITEEDGSIGELEQGDTISMEEKPYMVLMCGKNTLNNEMEIEELGNLYIDSTFSEDGKSLILPLE